MATGVSREKRPLCEAEVSISKAARVESAVPTLPIEMLENIVRYLPDADLKGFACTDSVNREVALRERSLRVLSKASQEVQQMRTLPPTITTTVKQTSPIADYIDLAANIQWAERRGEQPMSTDAEVISTLNQSLTAITTHRLAEEIFSLKQAFALGIKEHVIGWEDLDGGIQTLQEVLVAEAMIAVITASQNPDSKRGAAVVTAACNGHMHIVKTLLANNPSISDQNRNCAIKDAAIGGHLAIVKTLEEYGQISQGFREAAIRGAALYGHLDVVADLLARGPIHPKYRDQAFQYAVENGHLGVAKEIHKNGLYGKDKLDDFCFAAKAGHIELLKALLEIDPISAEDIERVKSAAFWTKQKAVLEFLDNLQREG